MSWIIFFYELKYILSNMKGLNSECNGVTKNNFLIASSIHINWCFKNLSKCVHRLRF